MANGDEGLIQGLNDVERAREGDHDAFVRLYRQDAPPAWRLALALTSDADRAADAVAEGFRTTLAPRRPSTARSPLPFRLRVLAATRNAALDGPSRDALPLPPPTAGVDDDDAPRVRSPRAAEVMAAFAKLPERWRTILWLLVVEGLGTLDAARVLGVRPEEAEQLADRAQAGLRERWSRDRRDAGDAEPQARDHLDRQLQPVLPLPRELFDLAQARWLATRRRERGPLRLVLPGGRPVPRWAERALVGATTALIAAGLASALAVESDPDRDTGSVLAAPPDGGGEGGGPSHDHMPMEPKAYLDDGPTATTGAARRRTATTTLSTPAGAGPTATGQPASTGAAGGSGDDGPTTTTTAPPLLEVTVGAGDALGLSLGDRCTGLEVAGSTLGCPPDTADEGLTLDVDSVLLPGS
jgi:DNA-directed RNA polymerase specialized sigma24 family protein